MTESRTITYCLKRIGNAQAFERSLVKISGILSVKVDLEKNTLSYEIDEWASDYDVFTEIMRIADECGVEIDFDAKPAEELEKEQESDIIKPTEQAVVANAEPEIVPEQEEEEEERPAKKSKKGLSERLQRVIEIGVSIAAYVVALFLTDIAQYIFLAIAFALCGYDALYEAIVKITKKQIFSEELVISLAFFASIFLGYAQYAVIAVLLYSIVAFARKIIREEIDKNPAFAKVNPKIAVMRDQKIKNLEISEVVVGDKVILAAGYTSPFDGVLSAECEVQDFKGNKRSASQGDYVYAGEKVLADAETVVTAIGGDCKYGRYNEFISSGASQTSPIAKFFEDYSQFINLGVLIVCLILTFVYPLFAKDYVSAMTAWGYKSVIIALVSGVTFYTFSTQINLLSALARSRKCMLGFSGYKAIEKLAKAKKVFLDYESALVDENGNQKEDARGAVRELKDTKVTEIALATSQNDQKTDEICKELKIKQCYQRETQEQRLEQLKKCVEEGGVCAISAKHYSSVAHENGVVVSLNCENEGYSGDVCISSGEIAYLPYAVKIAKKTAKIQKLNLVLGIAVKVVLIGLAAAGIAELWWAVLADSLVNVLCAVGAFLSSKQVY